MTEINYADEQNFMPITAPDEPIVCLACGLVTVTGARELHAAFHAWMDARAADDRDVQISPRPWRLDTFGNVVDANGEPVVSAFALHADAALVVALVNGADLENPDKR